MTINEIRKAIKEVIAEAKEKGLPKSGGKLVELKKELKQLKAMKESLAQYTINEGTTEPVVEFAHLQRFVNEMAKIKMAHNKLAEMLDTQISEVEGKVAAETQKIKEMMGLVQPQAEAKKKKPAKKEEPKEEPKEDKKKAKELDENLGHNEISSIHQEGNSWIVTYRTADGVKEKVFKSEEEAREFYNSLDEARFKKGEDIGKPGKGFAKIAKSAAKQYGSKEAGQKVAGAILKKVMKKESYDGDSKDLAAMAKSSNILRNKPETKELAKKAAEQGKDKDEVSSIAVKLAKAKGIKDSEQITHIIDLAVSMFKNK